MNNILKTILQIFGFDFTVQSRTITEADLDRAEAQGQDVSAFREKIAERREREDAERARILAENFNPTDLSKLDPFIEIPRSSTTDFFQAIAGKPPKLGSKEKWEKTFTEAQIGYAGVLAAPDEAWLKSRHSIDSHHIILIYAADEEHIRNVEWLKDIVSQLTQMEQGRIETPNDCAQLVESMKDEESWLSGRLNASIVGDARVYFSMNVIYDNELPNGYLPSDGIIPIIYKCMPTIKDDGHIINVIPGRFYSK